MRRRTGTRPTKSRSDTASIEFAAGRSKPSSAATAVRIERQRRAGQRTGAERRHRGALVPVPQAVDVAGQRVHVGQQVVGQQHRLGVLQVRHARHRDVAMPLGQPDRARVSRSAIALHEPADVVAQVQAKVGRDLVVAAAPGPQLAAEGAEALDQARVRARCGRPRRRRSGRNSPVRPPRSRSSSAASIAVKLVVGEQPAGCSTRACAFDAARS